jgi:hypothetical protein
LFDQDAYHVWLMEVVTLAQQERREKDLKAQADKAKAAQKRH